MNFEYTFHVNEKKGIVVARCTEPLVAISHVVDTVAYKNRTKPHMRDIFDIYYRSIDTRWLESWLKSRQLNGFVAYAKCDVENDNFDIEFGKQLALKRLDALMADVVNDLFMEVYSQIAASAHPFYLKALEEGSYGYYLKNAVVPNMIDEHFED